ncbi:hypothetical protein HIV01_004275 [Lysobacter arenosi]|uniref:Uncharacterized protein n=1 Tax=Lysobacter arenosi TaxID=2795387 RepID=A0ABX7RE44_9GAMM|nr:hypothetical protein [Lysobacter arenosi]QSX75748.1 hypothetical protein HIV01_004275 [Lysobacter arenosi]
MDELGTPVLMPPFPPLAGALTSENWEEENRAAIAKWHGDVAVTHMLGTNPKLGALFAHYGITPPASRLDLKDPWQCLALRMAMDFVPGFQASPSRKRTKSTWTVPEQARLVLAVLDKMASGTALSPVKSAHTACMALARKEPWNANGNKAESLYTRFKEAKAHPLIACMLHIEDDPRLGDPVRAQELSRYGLSVLASMDGGAPRPARPENGTE